MKLQNFGEEEIKITGATFSSTTCIAQYEVLEHYMYHSY
jgi:hypothetical protein